MRKPLIFTAIAAPLALSGCTDTEKAKWGSLGDPAHILCYSGGVRVYDGYSTGKVQNPDGSDGYQFMSQETGRLTEVSGDCQINYGSRAAK